MTQYSLLMRTLPWLRHAFVLVLIAEAALAQVDTSQVLGRVIAPTGMMVAKARVELKSLDQGNTRVVFTEESGLFVFPNVHPGNYQLTVSAPAFRTVLLRPLTLYTQQDLQQNFYLTPGSPLEEINLKQTGTPIATTGTVGTVVDGDLVRELPLNGRSFQTLYQLTPGVVLTHTDFANRGQFSTNGQRSNSNGVFVDGVNANFDISPGLPLGESAGGLLPVSTAFGGTTALASIDDVQEFVVLTSSYAPEFGRFSGGQISIVTRSGTNDVHGSAYDYLRNDAFDANDWFANSNRLPRAAVKQNDFGATLGGPITRNSIFWFSSYEGLRLQQPTSRVTSVPSVQARREAAPEMRPFLNAYPLPTAQEQNDVVAPAIYSFSNPSGMLSFSAKLDLQPKEALRMFARYFQADSNHQDRGAASNTLSSITLTRFVSQGITAGIVAGTGTTKQMDLRFNYSHSSASATDKLDQFGGAIIPNQVLFPAPFSEADGIFQFSPEATTFMPLLSLGKKAENRQAVLNVVANSSFQAGRHIIKVGVDFRRTSPTVMPPLYTQLTLFPTIPMAQAVLGGFNAIASSVAVRSTFQNYSSYMQDSWNVNKSLKLSAGIRWDVNPTLSGRASNGSSPAVLRGVGDASGPVILTSRSLYRSPVLNLAPRFGFSYAFGELNGPIVQFGCGLFYDQSSAPSGNAVSSTFFPFFANKFSFNRPFPLEGPDAQAPKLPPSPPFATIQAFPARLLLPRTAQLNVGIYQPLGHAQSISATYISSVGRSLLRTEEFEGGTVALPPDFLEVLMTNNSGVSRYDSLQIRYQVFGSYSVHVIASYALSHSKDNVSNNVSLGIPVRFIDPHIDYAYSDFDVRQTLNIGLHYQPRNVRYKVFSKVLAGWSFDPILWYRSPQPVDITVQRDIGFGVYNFRPDLMPFASIYTKSPGAPGNRILNSQAFTVPTAPRQGNLPRNFARGFSLTQADLAISRSVVKWRQVHIKLRIEAFNIFNHPNFSLPLGLLGTIQPDGIFVANRNFGFAAESFAEGLQSQAAGSGFSPLYQVGGRRSLQMAVRLDF